MSEPAEEEKPDPPCRTHAEAVEQAISLQRLDGGGFVVVHRAKCLDQLFSDDCPCHPVVVEVAGCDG